jgi:erythromycin esterase-like protein
LLLWAHNGHVGVIEGGPGRTDPPLMLGGHLRRMLGADYLAVGFAFDRGGLVAWGQQRFEAHAMPASVDGSTEAVLRRHPAPAYYADLRTAPAGAVSAWLTTPRPVRTVGSNYDASFWDRYFRPESLRTLYDVLVFVAAVTPSRPLFDPNVIAP